MKKLLQVLTILFVGSLLLAACGDDDAEQTESETNESLEQEETEESEVEEETEVSEEESDDDSNSDGVRGDTTEDQEDLSIGDTGKIDSELATYEITLENARLFDE